MVVSPEVHRTTARWAQVPQVWVALETSQQLLVHLLRKHLIVQVHLRTGLPATHLGNLRPDLPEEALGEGGPAVQGVRYTRRTTVTVGVVVLGGIRLF